MSRARLALTAGFDAAPHVLALAESLARNEYDVVAIIVVTPFSLSRLRGRIRQYGFAGLVHAGSRMMPRLFSLSDSSASRSLTNVAGRSLRVWARRHDAIYITTRDLNSDECVSKLSAMKVAGVVYGGGGILRTPFIDAARRRVLNAHAGPLPAVRGMNATEWSLLLRIHPTVSIHAIDEGIDTGPVFERIPIPIGAGDTLETLRERGTLLGVEGIVRNAWRFEGTEWPDTTVTQQPTRQCFVLAPILKELALIRLGAVVAP